MAGQVPGEAGVVDVDFVEEGGGEEEVGYVFSLVIVTPQSVASEAVEDK